MIQTINKEKLNNIIEKAFICFFIMQPIFDLKIFYNSISTLIRVIAIFIFFMYYFLLSKNKYKYWLFLYPTFLSIYFIFHHFNALNFHSLIPGDFNYSIFNEFLYFLKMICPSLLIYSLYKSKINKTTIFNIINIWVLIFSLIIIFSNIFCFSYCNYGFGIIKTNFFSWFNKNLQYDYTELLSKGLFEYGNQISALLIMFLPFALYNYFKNKKIKFIFIIFADLFALTLLGTRTAILGTFIVFLYFTFAYLLFEKNNLKEFTKLFLPTLLLLILFTACIPFNPIFSRLEENQKVIETVSNIDNTKIIETNLNKSNNFCEEVSLEKVENSEKVKNLKSIEKIEKSTKSISKEDFIENTYKENKINEDFITKRYPYTYDADFWYKIINSNNPNKANIRFLEQSMAQRVVEINNNSLDFFFGITYTRLQNLFNIEKDFVMQFYALGIVGVVLIFLPYLLLLILYIRCILKEKSKFVNTINILSFITIMFVFCISYFSGNLLNCLSFTIYLAMIYKLLFDNFHFFINKFILKNKCDNTI